MICSRIVWGPPNLRSSRFPSFEHVPETYGSYSSIHWRAEGWWILNKGEIGGGEQLQKLNL